MFKKMLLYSMASDVCLEAKVRSSLMALWNKSQFKTDDAIGVRENKVWPQRNPKSLDETQSRTETPKEAQRYLPELMLRKAQKGRA